MEMLGRFSLKLRYQSFRSWYYLNNDGEHGLRMLPLQDENNIRVFTWEILELNLNLVRHVYMEHKKNELTIVYPNLLMKTPTKRIQKLVYIKVSQNPNATVDDCTRYAFEMMGI
ncbi:hypothetical protein LXL04_002001 [Taraxacum kok-saghyz]